jgi:hypothetical protein
LGSDAIEVCADGMDLIKPDASWLSSGRRRASVGPPPQENLTRLTAVPERGVGNDATALLLGDTIPKWLAGPTQSGPGGSLEDRYLVNLREHEQFHIHRYDRRA